MRDDDGIDFSRIEPGGFEIFHVLAGDAVGGLGPQLAIAGIDDDQFLAGVHDNRRVGNSHLIFWQMAFLES